MLRDTTPMVHEIDALLAKLDAHPESLIFARLADMYAKVGKMDHAVHICEQGLSYRPDYVSGHLVMAKCYLKIGLLDQAKAEYQHVLAMDNAHIAALLQLGDVFMNEKDYAQSLAYYRQILDHDPLNESAQQHITHLQNHKALCADRPTNDPADPNNEESSSGDIATPTLAEIYAAQGLLERAIQVLRCIHERYPDEANIAVRIQELEQQMMQDGGAYGHNV